MPVNNTLPPVKLPVKLKTFALPKTNYIEQLANIDVTLLSAPSYDEILSYIPEFVTATWRDNPCVEFSKEEADGILTDLFAGLLLPTAFETINLTFRIDGLDMIDVTHLIRHRSLSFSAQCTADRDLRFDDVLVKPGILHSEYLNKFKDIADQAKQLYADMVDSNEISILDARTILPRAMPAFYYAKGNLRDILSFIRTRLDEQIQPQSDNVIAMKMFIEVVKQYPKLKYSCTIGGKDDWYINTARSGRNSNIYKPKLENDVFEYNDKDFLYKKRRDQFNGSYVYEGIKAACIAELEAIE